MSKINSYNKNRRREKEWTEKQFGLAVDTDGKKEFIIAGKGVLHNGKCNCGNC